MNHTTSQGLFDAGLYTEEMDKLRTQNDRLRFELGNAEERIAKLEAMVMDVIGQGCYTDTPGELDSMALTSYADALRYLAEHGYVNIHHDVGRRVLATMLPP